MKPVNDFAHKQQKYMPTFPKATGKPTVYIPGYPYEDEEPMPATGFHGEQTSILYEQFSSYFATQPHIYVGVDNFIYYPRRRCHEKRRPRYLCRFRCSEISAPQEFLHLGQKVRYQRLFLSSYPIQPPMRDPRRKGPYLPARYGGTRNTSSISPRWRNLQSFAGGDGTLRHHCRDTP